MSRELLGKIRRWFSPRPVTGRQVRVYPAVVLAVLLAVIALLGLTTDVFRSSRSIVRGALRAAVAPRDAELRFLIDVRTTPDPTGRRFTHAQLRAGPGPLLRSSGQGVMLETPFRLILERKGVTLTIRGTTIVRDGAGYVRLSELPAYGRFSTVLEGRWLQVGERRATPGRDLSRDKEEQILRSVLSSTVLTDVRRGPTEDVRGIRTRVYDLVFDDAQLRALLRELPERVPDPAGVGVAARYLEGRLADFQVSLVRLWVRRSPREVVRARLELVPRREGADVQRIILDATVLPKSGLSVSESPANPVRLRPETIRALFSR